VSARSPPAGAGWSSVAVGGVRAARAVQVIIDVGAVGQWPVLEPRNFSRSFDRRILKAQVFRITVHGTWETCGPLLAALDVHPRVAVQILRHSKIAVTMEIYTEVPSAATREAPGRSDSGWPLRPLLCFSAARASKTASYMIATGR
jgi:hypothetical protein